MQMDDPIPENGRMRGKAKWLVYINHFIVGWDDNIWMFAMGLFLMEITPESLQFTAVYGLVGGVAVLLFGTVVGDWVDKTSRLTVARVSVLVQNSAVIVCCVLIYIVLEYKEAIAGALPSEGLLRMCYAFIVLIAVFSNLTHMARTTAIERDWIVEICNKDKDLLARLSATMRRISLLTMVVAPIVTGQVLSRTSHSFGALVIAGWNFLTVFAEYFLLIKVYDAVPQLHREKKREERHQDIVLMQGVDVAMEFTQMQSDNVDKTAETLGMVNEIPVEPVEVVREVKRPRYTFWTSLCASAITLRRGWKIYTGYDVVFAGLSLASLYMTVLSFHSVTVGFAYSQGLSEDLIGGLLAVAACSGIIGTFLFPYVRIRIGLQRTGLYALAAEISSLTLCVVSIFCPGSPFELLTGTGLESIKELQKNFSDVSWSAHILDNSTQLPNNSSWEVLDQQAVSSYISISLLLTGIIGARIGLWMADLTITQLFLESVDVTERGIVAGVQNALNQLMDMLQYAIVILLPVPEQFGYLVILSYCFICIGWILFAVYVKRTRGYVFPCFRPMKQQTDTDICRENY